MSFGKGSITCSYLSLDWFSLKEIYDRGTESVEQDQTAHISGLIFTFTFCKINQWYRTAGQMVVDMDDLPYKLFTFGSFWPLTDFSIDRKYFKPFPNDKF